MIKIDKHTKSQLLELHKSKKISLEGNILKVIDSENDSEFEKYIQEATEKDKEIRRKRLEVTRRVQSQNTDLIKSKKENDLVNKQLKEALSAAEESNREMLNAKEQTERALEEAEKARLEAEKARLEAENARQEAEKAKNTAVNDLELMQRKTQFELIGNIVRAALWVILGVGFITTGMYVLALLTGLDTQVISATWSNIIGILLTNAFSIVGTIMGVKYASEKSDTK